MVRKHNNGEWSNHKRRVIRPSYERIELEIFSYDHQYTKIFTPKSQKYRGTNLEKINHRSLKCYKSDDDMTSYTIEFDYNVKEEGEYRIDILYENRNAKDYIGEYSLTLAKEKPTKLYSNTANVMSYVSKIKELNKNVKKVKTKVSKEIAELKEKLEKEQKKKKDKDKKKITELKKAIAKYESELQKAEKQVEKVQSTLTKVHRMVGGKEISFDGERNITKRKTMFHQLNEKGKYTLALEFPPNCYFIGLIFRKVLTFTGDNLNSADTNLMFKEATISKSGQIKPAEATFEIAYDTRFENSLTSTGFYFDYGDEVNIKVKENNDAANTKMVRRFGGYISTISHDNNRSKITFNCADRLLDGESKYILDSMLILKGTTSESEMEYNKPLNFNSYGQALKYLCDIHETTLKSNIKKNYLVQGEKYSTGLAIRFGSKKDIKTKKMLNPKNCTIQLHKKFITIRNASNGTKKQTITLYNGKEHSKLPIALKKVAKGKIQQNHLTLHLTYGMGDPVKTSQSSSTDQISNADGSIGNFGKCGQSADKKTVMSIAKPSSGRFEGLNGSTWYKVVFKNECPHCHKHNLRYDSGTSKTDCITCGPYNGSKRTWGDISEGEVTCNSCCADFCGATGWDKDGHFSARLTTVVKPVKSSEAERNKLLDGGMSGAGSITVNKDNIFKEITKEAFKYRYHLGGGGQTWAEMKKIGYGDCFGFSDLIYRMMSKFGVKCKIVEYAATGGANNHHSVMYANSKGQWVDFPYRQLGWNTKYNNQLNNTAGSANGYVVAINKAGKSIDYAKGTISSTSKTTTNITTTTGYDKDKPYQAYIEMTYSTEQSWKAKKKKVNITFTQKAGTNNDITGLPNYWVNNAQRQVSVDMKGWFTDNEPNKNIYLHTIRLVTPIIKPTKDDNNTTWYTYNKSTHDNSSCKMDLYQLIFDDKNELNPTDLQSCGKTVNSMMEDLVTQSKYRVKMQYAKHRKDDKILFSVDDRTKASFTAQEGDNNNILEWSNITCSPVTVLRNTSICVYKDSKGKYQYVDTRDINTLIKYGEQATLQTESEVNGSKQAYFIARNSNDYNPEFDYTYTIVVPYAPNLQLGDLVRTIANQQYLNDVKPIESLQIKYSNKTKPILQTTLGLGEIEPYLRIKQEMQKLRTSTKKKQTTFSTTATPVQDEEVYIWED